MLPDRADIGSNTRAEIVPPSASHGGNSGRVISAFRRSSSAHRLAYHPDAKTGALVDPVARLGSVVHYMLP